MMRLSLTILLALTFGFSAAAQETPGKDQSPSTTGGRSTSVTELPGSEGEKNEPKKLPDQKLNPQEASPQPETSSKSVDDDKK